MYLSGHHVFSPRTYTNVFYWHTNKIFNKYNIRLRLNWELVPGSKLGGWFRPAREGLVDWLDAGEDREVGLVVSV